MTRDEACRILNVTPSTDLPTIRQQYRRLASRYHPDRFHTAREREAATERFQAVAEAFALLRTEARDSRRRSRRGAEGPASSPSANQSTAAPPSTAVWWRRVDLREATADIAPRAGAQGGRPDLGNSPIVSAGDTVGMLLLSPILFPSIVARRLSRTLVSAGREGLGLPNIVSNFLGTFAGHLVPGFLGLELGRALIVAPGQRSMAAVAYGMWWVVSSALAVGLDRVA